MLYKFLATSCVKCLEGKDAGKIYGCYDWGFTYDSSRPLPDTFGGVLLGPYVYNGIADQ